MALSAQQSSDLSAALKGFASRQAKVPGSPYNTSNPTVFSDENIRQDKIPEIQNRANAAIPTVPTNQPGDQSTGDYSSMLDSAYKALGIDVNAPSISPEQQSLIDLMRNESDAQARSAIEGIQTQYSQLQKDLVRSQASSGKKLENLLLTGGGAHTASSAGALDAKASADIRDLAYLQNQEKAKIAEVKAAQQQQNFQLMQKQLDQLDKVRETKLAMANKVADRLYEQNQKTASNLEAAKQDAAATAAKYKAPTTVFDAINSATSASDAYRAIVGYGGENKLDTQVVDFDGSKALINTQTGQVIKWLGGGTPTGTASPATGAGAGAMADIYGDFLVGRTAQQVAAFNAIPDKEKATIQQLVDGDALFTDVVKSRGKDTKAQIENLLTLVKSVDPSFSINNSKIRFDFKKAWLNDNVKGSVGSQNAINTALGHLATLKNLSEDLPQGSLNKLNSVQNILYKETGDPAVIKFRIALSALGSELAKVYKGGVPNEGEEKEWKENLAANFSSRQFQGATDTAAELLSSKITALRYQYKKAMGKEYTQPLIDPDKRQELIGAGINPDAIAKEDVPGLEETPFIPQTVGDFLNNPIPKDESASQPVVDYSPDFWNKLK